MIWTLNFVMHGYLFGPIRHKPMIKFTYLNSFISGNVVSTSDGGPVQTTIGQVTLTANGQPTSNITESIDYHLIDVNDDYGFGYDMTDFTGSGGSGARDILGRPLDSLAEE
jgi:hypothetical protein